MCIFQFCLSDGPLHGPAPGFPGSIPVPLHRNSFISQFIAALASLAPPVTDSSARQGRGNFKAAMENGS